MKLTTRYFVLDPRQTEPGPYPALIATAARAAMRCFAEIIAPLDPALSDELMIAVAIEQSRPVDGATPAKDSNADCHIDYLERLREAEGVIRTAAERSWAIGSGAVEDYYKKYLRPVEEKTDEAKNRV